MERFSSSSYERKFIKRDILVCRLYRQGLCPDEEDCLLPHVNNPERIADRVCRLYIKENCPFGNRCDYDHVHFLQKNGEIILELVRGQDKLRYSPRDCSSTRDSRLSEVPATSLRKREKISATQSPELHCPEQSKTKCDNVIDSATANVSYSKVDRKSHNPLTSDSKCGTLSIKKSIQTSLSSCDNTLYGSQSLRYNNVSAYNDSTKVKFFEKKEKLVTGRKYPNSKPDRGERRAEHPELKRVSSNRSRTSNISSPFQNPCNVFSQGRMTKDNKILKESAVIEKCVSNINTSKFPVNSSSDQIYRSTTEDVTEDKVILNNLSMPSTSENYVTDVIEEASKNCAEVSTPASRTLSSCEKKEFVQSADSVLDVKQPKTKSLGQSIRSTTGLRYWSGLIDLVEPQEHLNIKIISKERSDITCSTFPNLPNAFPQVRGEMEDKILNKLSANETSVSSSKISQKFPASLSPYQTFMGINNDVIKDEFCTKDSSEEQEKVKDKNLNKPSVNKSSPEIPKYCSNSFPCQTIMDIDNEVMKGKFFMDYLSVPSTSKSFFTDEKKEDIPQSCEEIAIPTSSAVSSYERVQTMPDPVSNLKVEGVREPHISLLRPLSNDPGKTYQTFDIDEEPSIAPRVACKPATREWTHRDPISDAKLSKMQSWSNSEIRKTPKPDSPTTSNKTEEDGFRKTKARNAQTWRHQSEGQN